MSLTAEHLRNIATALILGAVVSVAALMVFSTFRLLALTEQADSQRTLILECTTPPSEREPPVRKPEPDDCYVRANSRTGDAVASINEVSIAAAACGAAHPGDVKATEACVRKTLGG